MLITTLNIAVCATALVVGVYTFTRHLNAFNHNKTPTVDAWLVAVGTLAWSLALYANIQDMSAFGSMDSDKIGLSTAQTLTNALMLCFWLGVIHEKYL